jgi:hypothetical protein
VRRYLRGHGIFEPDRGHLHHRLLDRGFATRRVALILYVLATALAVVGFVLAHNTRLAAALVAVCAVCAVAFMQMLRFDEFEELMRALWRTAQQRRVIGRSVRFREAASRLAALDDLRDVFEALEQVFEADGAPQAQIRMRREFVQDRFDAATAGRGDDELVMWTWTRNGGPPSSCWEIALPLTSPDCERIGSLVVWEDAESGTSLSHLRAVREYLSSELQRKLFSMGCHPHSAPIAGAIGPASERSPRRRSGHRALEPLGAASVEPRGRIERQPVLAEES